MKNLDHRASFSSVLPPLSSPTRRFSSWSFRHSSAKAAAIRKMLLNNRRFSKKRRASDTWSQLAALSDQNKEINNNEQEEQGKKSQKQSEWVRLIVGGTSFLTRRHNLLCFPESRLSCLMRATEARTMLTLCDHYVPPLCTELSKISSKINSFGENVSIKMSNFSLEQTSPTFVFDRSARHFEMILDAYRRGTLHLDHYGCVSVIKNELDYWRLDEAILQPCCALRFQQDAETCVDDLRQAEVEEAKDLRRINCEQHDLKTSYWTKCKMFVWHTLEEHDANLIAKILAILSVLVIVGSSFTLVLSQSLSEQDLNREIDFLHFQTIGDVLVLCETCAYIYFTVEYLLRLISTPQRIKFIFSVLNLVDILTILPFILALATYEHKAVYVVGKASKLLHLLRLIRIFRIFKVLRHVASLRSLLQSLRSAHRELRLLLVVIVICSLFFATLIFHAEKSKANFGDTLYLTLLTMAGFEGLAPETLLGKFASLVCSMIGVIIITLPVPIVIRSFRAYYRHRLMKRVVELRNERRYRHLFHEKSRPRRSTKTLLTNFVHVESLANGNNNNNNNNGDLFHV